LLEAGNDKQVLRPLQPYAQLGLESTVMPACQPLKMLCECNDRLTDRGKTASVDVQSVWRYALAAKNLAAALTQQHAKQ
jgi:hypothetical protein